jgi:hypothetical protein
MKNTFLFLVFGFYMTALQAQHVKPDTVKAGIYITSIHNIDFKQKEYEIHFWVWFKYKNPNLNFSEFLEIPNAKTFTRLFDTVQNTNDEIYAQMKFQCTMNDTWKVGNFPFDHQVLRIRFENSQYVTDSMVFVIDNSGEPYDIASEKKGRLISGWSIDSIDISAGEKIYKTRFGDDKVAAPKEVYSAFRVKINISRPVFGLFLKTFLGMYIAFLIAFLCFFIHTDGIDSRFSLSVGSLFAVIGNKYIIDSSLPETTSFNLVDTLHGFTLFVIFIVVASTITSLKFIKQGKIKTAWRVDIIVGIATLLLYLTANIYFILKAISANN